MCGHKPASNYNAGIMIPSDVCMFLKAATSQLFHMKWIHGNFEVRPEILYMN